MGTKTSGPEEEHYTALIEITKTSPEKREPTSGYNATPKVTPRSVTEVTRVVVRSTELFKLVEKIKAHVDLVEEI